MCSSYGLHLICGGLFAYNNIKFITSLGAMVAQSLATDWTTGRWRFDPWQTQEDFASSICVRTGSRAHPASCPMGTWVLSLGVRHGRGMTLTTHPHLVQRSGMSSSYTPLLPSASMVCSGTALLLL
jgi:hypothetical protein